MDLLSTIKCADELALPFVAAAVFVCSLYRCVRKKIVFTSIRKARINDKNCI